MIQQIIFFLLIFVILVYLLYKIVEKYLIGEYYYQKVDHFERYPVVPGDIVFVGDSITDFGPWNEIFPDYPIKNRGISADNVKGVYQRLRNIVSGKPAVIFLLIGTNDLIFWFSHRDRYILRYYRMILREIREKSPAAKVYVQSIFPRHKRYSGRIIRLNRELAELAKTEGAEFIDIYASLAAENGELKKNLTNDSLHLMAEGYQIWADKIRPFLPD